VVHHSTAVLVRKGDRVNAAEQEAPIEGPKPISISISAHDVQALYTCGTNPDAYNQLLLAALKDAGGPVEGILHLRLATGKLCKLKDKALEPQDAFTYLWISDAYVAAIAQGGNA
jgi:hypothetical protein